MLPSEWAEANRVLTKEESAEPGPWRNARVPYAVGIMDAVVEPGVEEITFIKSAQVAGSEIFRNIIGFWIDHDPGPCLLVLPTEDIGEKAFNERVIPLLKNSPALAKHLSPRPHDTKLDSIKLDTMPLHLAWSNSPASLASRPCRYVGFDEVDKFPAFSGREANPIALGTERTATYGHRRRILKISTPTTREGAIWKAWEASGDKRHYHVPCPHCSHVQRLVFTQIKWPPRENADPVKHADDIEQNRTAYYQCEKCKGKIEDRHKPTMLGAGKWISETPGVRSKKVGFHISALYSPWRTFSEIAGAFIRAKGDPAELMNFRNSWLGEPFEDQIMSVKTSAIREKIAVAPQPGTVPNWAKFLLVTADTQTDRFYWVCRAWGVGYRSQLVSYGEVSTFDDLTAATLGVVYPWSGYGEISPQLMLIDSGGGRTQTEGVSRTDEVYEYARKMGSDRVWCLKGASHEMKLPFSVTTSTKSGIALRLINTDFYQDMLARFIADQDATRWMPHSLCDDEYATQMASHHKILVMNKGRRELVWAKVSAGAADHIWDCETYHCAFADMLGVGHLRDEESPPIQQPKQLQSQGRSESDQPRRPESNWATSHKKW